MATGLFDKKPIPDADMDESPIADTAPEFPGATEEAPYGYKADGTPYKRRPNAGGARLVGGKRMPASETQARTAASLLARLNSIVGLGFMAAQMPQTALAIETGNKDFEELAYQALLTDPALCKRILGAGTMSGKAALIMAYGMLGVSIFPAARVEIIEKRNKELEEASHG